jgi:hypothetical protein
MRPSRIFPVAGDGWKFVLGFAVLGAVFYVHRALGSPGGVGGVFVLAAVFSIYFFRDGGGSSP